MCFLHQYLLTLPCGSENVTNNVESVLVRRRHLDNLAPSGRGVLGGVASWQKDRLHHTLQKQKFVWSQFSLTHTHQLRMSLTTCTGKPNIELKQIARRKEGGEKGCGEGHQQCLPWSIFVIRCSEVRPGIFETSIQRSGGKSLFLPESWRLLIALGKILSLTKTAHWFLQRPRNKSPITQQKRPEPLRKFRACCCRPLVAKCHR